MAGTGALTMLANGLYTSTILNAPVFSSGLLGPKDNGASVPAGDNNYLRPGGVDTYYRPGGTDTYIRP